MAHHSTKNANMRLHRVVLGGIIVTLLSALTVGIGEFKPSTPVLSPAPIAVSASPTTSADSSTLPSATLSPSIVPSVTSVTPVAVAPVVSEPVIPDLKLEVQGGTAHFVFPSIGFDEPLVPLEISFAATGQPVLPQDVRAYFATNLRSTNCAVSGGDFILGHTSTFTDYWGKVPFNAFKSLAPGDGGQMFSIGGRQYIATKVIVQPKAALITTEVFWCQPPGNISIVACYTQEEGGDNVIVIGRPVS